MELLTGLGLATASGLNAYIPLLALGLLSRFTDLITLPHGWAWLENGWVMAIVAVLLVVEIVADKIPALDSVNDAIQTFVRPTSGGIVFGSGTAAQTHAVTDPGAFAQSGQWIPIVVGVLVALTVSLTKSAVRPAANVATAGFAAPVLSTIEDGVSVASGIPGDSDTCRGPLRDGAPGVGGRQALAATAAQGEGRRKRELRFVNPRGSRPGTLFRGRGARSRRPCRRRPRRRR